MEACRENLRPAMDVNDDDYYYYLVYYWHKMDLRS